MITAEQLCTLVPTLSKFDFLIMLKTILNIKTEKDRANITELTCLKAGIWECMKAIGFVTDAQGLKILEKLEEPLKELLDRFSSFRFGGGIFHPVLLLSFLEQRWVVWSNCPTYYDMLYDEDVEVTVEHPAVLIVSCDIATLYLRQKLKLQSKDKDKDEKS